MDSEDASGKEEEHKVQAIEIENAEIAASCVSLMKEKEKGRFGFWLGKIGLEMIPVVAGILIALFISNLQQNRRDRRLLESTMESLTTEFSGNRKNIEASLPRQQLFLDTLRHYMDDRTYCIFDMSNKTGGMGTPEIHATNWHSSLNNNSLGLLNFATVNLLSQIDAKYQELRDQESFMYPIAYGPPMFRKGEDGWEYRKGLELWVISYVSNERELLALYDRFEQVVHAKDYVRGR